jgi:hypothetical protein
MVNRASGPRGDAGPSAVILLWAERSGDGPGRDYDLTFKVTDAAGNVTAAAGIVSVPHNRVRITQR